MNSQPNYRNCVQHRTLRNLRQAEQYVAGTNYELLLEMGVTKHAGSRNVILSFDGKTDKGGIGIGSSGTQKNNVSENHSEVEHELTIEIKNRAQTRKARQARLHTGREIAAKGGIPY